MMYANIYFEKRSSYIAVHSENEISIDAYDTERTYY